jgi:hypothetical protein
MEIHLLPAFNIKVFASTMPGKDSILRKKDHFRRSEFVTSSLHLGRILSL